MYLLWSETLKRLTDGKSVFRKLITKTKKETCVLGGGVELVNKRIPVKKYTGVQWIGLCSFVCSGSSLELLMCLILSACISLCTTGIYYYHVDIHLLRVRFC